MLSDDSSSKIARLVNVEISWSRGLTLIRRGFAFPEYVLLSYNQGPSLLAKNLYSNLRDFRTEIIQSEAIFPPTGTLSSDGLTVNIRLPNFGCPCLTFTATCYVFLNFRNISEDEWAALLCEEHLFSSTPMKFVL